MRPQGSKEMTGYTVLIVKGKNEGNYGAWVPDLPGCISTGLTIRETKANIREAIELHLRGIREDGDPIPAPSRAVSVKVT
jgi:predicted RNase H-like HicB family nuclease